ncbi:MAG: hypothetical protein WB729_20925 [Candidatus Sulfotelmatobacter sp.]|jgi:hypothetical protein
MKAFAGRKLSILFLLALLGSTLNAQSHNSEIDPVVPRFAVDNVSALQALVRLSGISHNPLGIVQGDEDLCKTQVTVSVDGAQVSTIAGRILAAVPGYSWRAAAGSQVIIVAPNAMPPAAKQFLELIDDRYKAKGNTQTLAMTLWVHVRSILYPEQGTAGSILSSADDPVFALDLKNASIEQILNQIAFVAGGTWILRPLPEKLIDIDGGPPFSITVASNPSDLNWGELCSPIRALEK